MRLKNIKKCNHLETVYDFEVKDKEHYILNNGIVCHNSGGGGIRYAASQIIFLGKRKDKEGNDLVGNIIVCTMKKSRFTQEGKKVETKLNFKTGLNRYYGLLPIAEKYGIFKKVGNKYELPDGKKYFEKAIYNDPEKHFTEDVLKRIDEACGEEFLYGVIDD